MITTPARARRKAESTDSSARTPRTPWDRPRQAVIDKRVFWTTRISAPKDRKVRPFRALSSALFTNRLSHVVCEDRRGEDP